MTQQWNDYADFKDRAAEYYGAVHECVVEAIDNCSIAIPKNSRGLDIACGYGDSTGLQKRWVDHVVGIDSSKTLISEARNRFANDQEMTF
ncbi:MAG: methyltransferase domain-containing protein, partial [Planctomycetota bacterium]